VYHPAPLSMGDTPLFFKKEKLPPNMLINENYYDKYRDL
jgi:hypothetical protein